MLLSTRLHRSSVADARAAALCRRGDRLVRAVLVGALVLMAVVWSPSTRAQPAAESFWRANGQVRTVAGDAQQLFFGGSFDYVGPYTGAAAVKAPSSFRVRGLGLRGDIQSAIDDGRGGWILGGTGLTVKGDTQAGGRALLHLLADGTINPVAWPQPGTDSLLPPSVSAAVLVGDRLYFGGQFSRVGDQARANAAAIDIRTGVLQAFDPGIAKDGLEPTVLAMAATDGDILIGGQFSKVGTVPVDTMARVDGQRGRVKPWAARFPSGSFVAGIAVSGTDVFVGGAFDTVSGATRNNVAALDAQTGQVTPWVTESINSYVRAIAVDRSTVYAGGIFVAPRVGVAAFERRSGATTPFDARLDLGIVETLALTPSGLWVGGGFLKAGGRDQHRLALLDTATGRLHPKSLHAGGFVQALAARSDGGMLVAGNTEGESSAFFKGRLDSVGGVPRRFAAAISKIDGRATAWNPAPSGSPEQFVVDDASVWAVGYFSRMGGKQRLYAAEVDKVSGRASAWSPPGHDAIGTLSIAVTPEHVYLGGYWLTIGGRSQPGFAQIDRGTGVLTNARLGTDPLGGVHALHVDAARNSLFVGGAFSQLAGQSRSALAELSLTDSQLTAFNPSVVGDRVTALARRDDTLYFGGDFARVNGQSRKNAAAIDLAPQSLTSWKPRVFGGDGDYFTVTSMIARPEAVYLAGGFSGGLEAVDAVTGETLNWGNSVTANNRAGLSLEDLGDGWLTVGSTGGLSRERLYAPAR